MQPVGIILGPSHFDFSPKRTDLARLQRHLSEGSSIMLYQP